MEVKSIASLNKFREMIDDSDDRAMMQSASDLLRDLLSVQRKKREIEELEAGMMDGAKGLFYFLAQSLCEEEIVYAAERVQGKLTRMQRAEDLKAERENPPQPSEDSQSE
jgi:hypothetical protein